jgi:hypothetical protein
MCTVLLPPGVNEIAVNNYVNISTYTSKFKPNSPSISFHTELKQLPKNSTNKEIHETDLQKKT